MDHAAILCSARLQKGRISPCSLQPQRRPPVHLATSQRSLATAGRDPLALALGADLDLETTSAGHEAEAEVREVRVSLATRDRMLLGRSQVTDAASSPLQHRWGVRSGTRKS